MTHQGLAVVFAPSILPGSFMDTKKNVEMIMLMLNHYVDVFISSVSGQ